MIQWEDSDQHRIPPPDCMQLAFNELTEHCRSTGNSNGEEKWHWELHLNDRWNIREGCCQTESRLNALGTKEGERGRESAIVACHSVSLLLRFKAANV